MNDDNENTYKITSKELVDKVKKSKEHHPNKEKKKTEGKRVSLIPNDIILHDVANLDKKKPRTMTIEDIDYIRIKAINENNNFSLGIRELLNLYDNCVALTKSENTYHISRELMVQADKVEIYKDLLDKLTRKTQVVTSLNPISKSDMEGLDNEFDDQDYNNFDFDDDEDDSDEIIDKHNDEVEDD